MSHSIKLFVTRAGEADNRFRHCLRMLFTFGVTPCANPTLIGVQMRSAGKVLLSLAFLVAMATPAVATPIEPTTPYPGDLQYNAAVCGVEKLEVDKQQLLHNAAKAKYDRDKRLYDAGTLGAFDMRATERALHQATIRFNAARYAEAACQNTAGGGEQKLCRGLALELNRLVDELPMWQEIEDLAKKDYDAKKALLNVSVSPEEVAAAELAWKVAQIERQQAEQRLTNQRNLIMAARVTGVDCKDVSFVRPQQAPPPRPVPVPPGDEDDA